MILEGFVLSADVLTSGFFDQVTGEKKPGVSVTLMVVEDADGSKEVYQCNLSEGFPTLDQFKQQIKLNAGRLPQDVVDQVVAQLRAELPPKMSHVVLDVRRIKAKQGFMTLVCRFAKVAATV